MNEKLILSEWGKIHRSKRRIEDLRIAIGQLKDNIMMAEQEIIRLQRDDQEGNANAPSTRTESMQQPSQ